MYNIIKTILLSFVLIITGHILWNYIRDAYSTKKTKDLVGSQTLKYKNILNEYIENSKLAPSLKPSYISETEQNTMSAELLELINT